jgi:uncharacterized protein
LNISIAGEDFTLCYEKCMLRRRDNALIIADVHLGKSNHFRKAGIAVPSKIIYDEIEKLITVIHKYQPNKVIFLGDLFHSSYNQSVELLKQIIDNEFSIKFILVEGNHDIMQRECYSKIGIEVVESLNENGIIYTHEAVENASQYNIYGHIHPGVTLTSKGKQSLRLPCFFVSSQYAVLPAFGLFTGLAMLKKNEEAIIYVVAEENVFLV